MVKLDNKELKYVVDFLTDIDETWITKNFQEITLESITNNDGSYNELLKPLVGYSFKIEKDGSHKNDGQLVGYTFIFKKDNGIITRFHTEMCLMIGFRFNSELEIY